MEEEIEEYVLSFKREFRKKFGTVPRVTYHLLDFSPLPVRSLKDIEKVADQLIISDKDMRKGTNIKTKRRHRNLILLRQCVFKIAKKEGYTVKSIGLHFGFTHGTVIHGCKTVDRLISVHDYQMMTVFNTLQNAIKNKYGHDGDV